MIATQSIIAGATPGQAGATCWRCSRALSDPISVAAGIGPICAAFVKAKAEQRNHAGDRFDLPFDPVLGDIVCIRAGAVRAFNIAPYYVYHSPDGFEWGYGGSGPADFALNIAARFIDHTKLGKRGEERIQLSKKGPLPHSIAADAWFLHQELKRRFVEVLPEAGGTIRGRDLREWLAGKGIPPEAIR